MFAASRDVETGYCTEEEEEEETLVPHAQWKDGILTRDVNYFRAAAAPPAALNYQGQGQTRACLRAGGVFKLVLHTIRVS